ncbi:hypothetical protein [Bacteroides fragilis]|uniref:hypothetical protein n=1 Tax=Bacteroides fragilis TaxID=817 RepID=UPI001C7086FC|nr:hypothetical protein [Bacteroides fragilis]MBW9279484.1 hypothetical protein [Bacteroides fragilis]
MAEYLCFYNFVHISLSQHTALLYNTINGAHMTVSNLLLVEKLRLLEECSDLSFYGIRIDADIAEVIDFQELTKFVLESISGNILSLDSEHMPIHIVPSLKVLNEQVPGAINRKVVQEKIFTENDRQKSYVHYNENVFQISFFINASCNDKWEGYPEAYRQYMFPEIGKNTELSFELIKTIVECNFPNLSQVNLIIGNVGDNNIVNINNLIKMLKVKTNLVVYILIDEFKKIALSEDKSVDITYVVWTNSYDNLCKLGDYSKFKQLFFQFLICDDRELKELESYSDSQNCFICFYYTGNNKEFCVENLSFSIDDLFNRRHEEKQLLANSALDSNHFGHLVILSNGEVYSNVNKPSIGRLPYDNVYDLLIREFSQYRHWFVTRKDIKPCSDCLFSVLCSSITDVEYCLNTYNLCDVK